MRPLSHPMNRRWFLASLGAGTAELVLRPRALRAAADRGPVSFIVLSDTHLGYRDQETAARRWEKTAAEIDAAPGGLVLHLGDVVDGGREAQYPVYLKTRERIGKPVHEIPGNHDPEKLFAKYLRRQVDTVVDHAWLRFLLLNNSRTDSHDGFLSAEQIAWIDRQCKSAAAEDRYVVVCMHVPAHKNLHPDGGWYVKPDHGQRELYATLEKHRDRVLALFHGHFHNGIRGWDDHRPVHEIVFPSALYNLDRRLEEQNAPGYNLPEFRPGFTLAEVRDGALKLRYRPVGVAEEAAEKVCRLEQFGS